MKIINDQAIHNICNLCFSLSSLVMMFDLQKKEFYFDRSFSPRLFITNASINEHCIPCVPANSEKPLVSSLKKLLDSEQVKEKPHEIVAKWLQFFNIKKSMEALHNKASSSEMLQKAIVSLLLCSSAILHYAHANEDNQKLLETRNLFLVIAIEVAKEINFCDLTFDHIMKGLDHYIDTITKLKIDPTNLDLLYIEICDLKDPKYNMLSQL